MIISVEELRKYITSNDTDEVLAAKIRAVEVMIRAYTHNNFQNRSYRHDADIVGGIIIADALIPFHEGDTVQIADSKWNDGLYTVATVQDSVYTVAESVANETNVTVTKVEYPPDIVMGVVNMLKWDMENRAKVGIQSETISRHSVTYFDMSAENSILGYPKSLIGFLRPYRKARF